ncbi:MAG: ferrous iron transport protein B, partial [Deltaproteobacteria bacterium]|nr:ferrous iron transport protein B [Deltaproteobacteria bacterium]
LGFSVILWVLMTFPGLSQEQAKSFEDRRQEVTRSFLASPQVRGWVGRNGDMDAGKLKAAAGYREFREQMIHIDAQEQQAALERTMAGWIGKRLEIITRPLGFDYRINIALVGGFAAKEVVVSTLGTAYSLGHADPDERGSLSERLKNDPDWNPLLAFTLLIFTMLYVPCFVTVISIRRESSWRWAGFSIAFNLVVAYLVALAVATVGRAAGLGL